VPDEDDLADALRAPGDQVVEVREVVEEVVVAAGPDPVAVAVAAQVRGEHAPVHREPFRDRLPPAPEIREAVDEHEHAVAAIVPATAPLDDVTGEPRREREVAIARRDHGLRLRLDRPHGAAGRRQEQLAAGIGVDRGGRGRPRGRRRDRSEVDDLERTVRLQPAFDRPWCELSEKKYQPVRSGSTRRDRPGRR